MSEQSVSDFNAFGSQIRPDFRGDFDSASVRDNVVLGGKGTFGIQTVTVNAQSQIGWTFEGTAGRRAIFVRYASKDERECELLVNGEVVQSHALFEPTETLKLIDWRYQCHAEFNDGENSIAIRCAKAMPAIHEIVVVDVDGGDMLSADEYLGPPRGAAREQGIAPAADGCPLVAPRHGRGNPRLRP